MKAVIIIPVRLGSLRLNGKPLLKAGGETLIQHTYKKAKGTELPVVVACCDPEVASHCQDEGIPWMDTDPELPNGTARCASLLNKIRDDKAPDFVINWQVDEPMVNSADVEALLNFSESHNVPGITTMVAKIDNIQALDRDLVKVVASQCKAHWFTREPIIGSFGHIGIYCYPSLILQTISNLKLTEYSQLESLEQLTWIEHGFIVRPLLIDRVPLSVNSVEDWATFLRIKEEKISHVN